MDSSVAARFWAKVAKSENVRGERHGGSKLTNEDVQLIRSLFKSRNTTTQKAAEQLAKLFGVSKTTITNIVYHYYWKEGDDQ